MSPGDRELLVIVSNDSTGSGGAGFPDRFPVVHSMSSRVFVIELPADASSQDVAALPGVTAVARKGATLEIPMRLDETEALFVQAWLEREGEGRKQRRADGFDWDADEFEPPDPPPGFDVEDRSA